MSGMTSFHLESAGKPARSKRFATKAGGADVQHDIFP
jgi:hypothetical protein